MLAVAAPRWTRWFSLKPSQHDAPIEVTPLAAETVRVTDPTHPFYGLELPLLGVSRKTRLGVVCVVWIRRGVERLVPVGATNLADELLEQCPQEVGVVHREAGTGHRLLDRFLRGGHRRAQAHPRRLDPLPLGESPLATTMTYWRKLLVK
jgi:hypothetical protein